MSVVTQRVAVSAERLGRQGQVDRIAAADYGCQDAVAMVEESEAMVISAPVDALSLLAFGRGQDPTPGYLKPLSVRRYS